MVGYEHFVLIVVINAFGAAGFGLANLAMMSMLADTVEYGQWKTGIRAEGMVFSTNILKTKMASALGGGIGAPALGLMAYDVDLPVHEAMLDRFHVMITIVPALIGAPAMFPLARYALTEARYEEMIGQMKSSDGELI